MAKGQVTELFSSQGWIVDSTITDYGEDLILQLTDKQSLMPIRFFIQLKGTKNFKKFEKSKFYSIPNHVMRVFFDLSKDTPENKSQDVEEFCEDLGNRVIYRDVYENLDSNKNIEQTIADFLGPNWFAKTDKFGSWMRLLWK